MTAQADHTGTSEKKLWLISLGVHLFVLVVIFFVPAKMYFEEEVTGPKKKPAEIKRRGEDLERVMEQVRDLTAERLAQKVALLDEGATRMATNFQTLNEFHQPIEEKRREAARDRVALFAGRTLEQMETLRDKLLAANRAEAPENRLEALEGAEALGSRILVGQEEIRRGFMYLSPENTTLDEKQRRAETDQIKAIEHLGWALDPLRGVATRRRKIAELRELLKEKRPALEKLVARKEEFQHQGQTLRDESKKLEQARRESKDRKEKERLTRKIETVTANMNETHNREREFAGRARPLNREVNQAERHLKNHLAALDAELKEAKWDAQLKFASSAQNSAFRSQQEVVDTLLEAANRNPSLIDE